MEKINSYPAQFGNIKLVEVEMPEIWISNRYCQNPNLTTNQPQPNLNLVGFDTIITLHTPHPPPPTTTTGTLLLQEIMILGV